MSYLYQRNLRHGKEIFLVATVQISSVQRCILTRHSDTTNIAKIWKKKFIWYNNVNFRVATMFNTLTLNQRKAFLGVRWQILKVGNIHCPWLFQTRERNKWRHFLDRTWAVVGVLPGHVVSGWRDLQHTSLAVQCRPSQFTAIRPRVTKKGREEVTTAKGFTRTPSHISVNRFPSA